MPSIKNHSITWIVSLFVICLLCAGCSLLERSLDKEGFEERRLFGNTYQHTSKITKLQMALAEIGYNPGGIDGKIGDKTRSAVKIFQKDYGLKVSGYVDKKTWVQLNKTYQKELLPFENISIKKIQTALENAGFDPGPIDGKSGPKTKRAIKEFRKSKDLTQDGEVDPKTWGELRKYLLQ